MKKNLGNSQAVYHAWAHQTQIEGYAGNCSFDGDRAYSYRAVIGRIVCPDTGDRAYIVSNHNYSVTTSKHQSYVNRSIPHGATVFHVENADTSDWEGKLQEILEDSAEIAAKAKRARQNKPWLENQSIERAEEAVRFAAFFGLTMPEGFDARDLEGRIAANETLKAEMEEKRRLETERLYAKLEIENRDKLAAWKAGSTSYFYDSSPYASLRIKGEEVQTSKSASVPVADVRKYKGILLDLIKKAMREGRAIDGQIDGFIKLGHYDVHSISSDGTLTIGCHRIKAEELRRIAELL